jgi:hypothetical protein
MKATRILPWLPCLVLLIGSVPGCSSTAPEANVPAPKPSSDVDQKKAAASVEAGRPKIQNIPGAPSPK